MPKIKIYTDGCCLDNNIGGWAFVALDGESKHSASGKLAKCTNNIAELYAVKKAIEYALDNQLKDIIIYSDSKYTIGCLTQWWQQWKKNGWTKKGGIKNLDLIRVILDQIGRFDSFEMKWVKAHNGNKYNERADVLASNAARRKDIKFEKSTKDSLDGHKVYPMRIDEVGQSEITIDKSKRDHAIEFLMFYTHMKRFQAETAYNRFTEELIKKS